MKIFLPKFRAAFFLKVYERHTVRKCKLSSFRPCVVCIRIIVNVWRAQEKNPAVGDCTLPFCALLSLGAYLIGGLL